MATRKMKRKNEPTPRPTGKRYSSNINYLADYGIISKWACRHYGLNMGDFQLLWHLCVNSPFSKKDFNEGTLRYSWDKRRFHRLKNAGWITNITDPKTLNRKAGDHLWYTTTTEVSRMITRVDRILQGHEDIPEGFMKNNISGDNGYSAKNLAKALRIRDEKMTKASLQKNKWDL